MPGITISNEVTITVTVGVGGYTSPLTITNTGYAAAGVYLDSVGNSLVNHGTIRGNQSDNRGYGVNAPFGSVVNYGSIFGASNSTGGYGGTGIGFTNESGLAVSLDNQGFIVGGVGGSGATGGGFGGNGATLASYRTSFTNSGTIFGGTGGEDLGSGTGQGGSGGIGVKLNTDVQGFNNKMIVGGAGGLGIVGDSGGVGGDGAYVFEQSTLTNFGTLIGGAGGSGGNDGGKGGTGAVIVYGTVINAGTIGGGAGGSGATHGTMGDAVSFRSGSSELIVDPGAVFLGSVVGTDQYYVGNTLAFGAGSVSGTVGTLYGVGSQIYGFKDIDFASGAAWTVGGTYTGFNGHEVIEGLAPSDTIILQGFAANPADVTFKAGTGLELTSGATTITLDIVGSFSTSSFVVTDPPGNTTISVVPTTPCFVAGTQILTVRGQVAVEELAVGDNVVLLDGGITPIVWIGRRRLDLRGHPRPETVQPIVVEAGAICDGVPARALLVSPDHALYLDGHLIPVKALVNSATIRQDEWCHITYFHVELADHAVIYAEGCPVESYLESGNRGAFENGGISVTLHPDFAQMTRETTGCAPFAESGPVVEAVRRRLLARAAIETTCVPNLSIRVRRDGTAVIASRSAIPGEIGADPRDRRQLGVKIAALRDGDRDIPLDHPALTDGWHAPESDGRWTNGSAVIPAVLARSGSISVLLTATLNYPLVARRHKAFMAQRIQVP